MRQQVRRITHSKDTVDMQGRELWSSFVLRVLTSKTTKRDYLSMSTNMNLRPSDG